MTYPRVLTHVGITVSDINAEDPWGNLIEIYSHDTVLIYANR